MVDKLVFDPSVIDVTGDSDSAGTGKWYMDGSGMVTYDPGISSGGYEAQTPQDDPTVGGGDPIGVPINTYEDNSASEAKEVVLSLTSAGLALAAQIMKATGASQSQAEQQVKMKYANDRSIVTVKEKMPVWAWVAIGLTGVGILGALGWLKFGKKK